MKFLKWLVVFVIAFIFAWILIFTFTQEQFRQAASARILAYRTPAIPIYFYVGGAFGIGLLLGLFTAFYYYIVLQARLRRTAKELHELERKLAEAQSVSEQSALSRQDDNSFNGRPELPVETEQPVETGGENISGSIK